MKRIILTAGLIASFSGSAFGGGYYGYHGCGPYWGCGPWWPGLAIGFGLGAITTAAAASHPTYVYSYGAPVVSYASAPVAYAARTVPTQPVAAPAPAIQESLVTKVWVPASRGAGRWVPDPNPYSYTASAESAVAKVAAPANAPPLVAANKSPGGVRVFVAGP